MNEPVFSVGQRVRIVARTPPVHHRVPAYVKGQIGVVERVCGLHGQPEKFIRGDGSPLTRLYRVSIPQTALWPNYDASSSDRLDVEIFEHWLDAAE